MANHGKTFEVVEASFKTKIYSGVSEARPDQAGVLRIWNTESQLLITYGPIGYLSVKEVYPTEWRTM